jgi:TM2 domain-containing membrane protein YozV
LNPICPYCRTEVGEAEGERTECPGCGTPHHADCFAENGGCTVFGCANAPSDEAKVTVSGTDLMGNTVTRQAPAPTSLPRPVIRPGLSLGSGFTTFRAPAVSAEQPAPQPTPGGNGAAPPGTTPPPPMAGTGIAPPPQAGPVPQVQRAPSSLAYYYPVAQPKNRVIFVLLGIFLGVFGVHNFYAGYVKKGAIQLCVTLLSCFYAAVVSLIWAIIEVCTVNKDAEGTQFV